MQEWIGKKREAGKRDVHGDGIGEGNYNSTTQLSLSISANWLPMDPLVPLGQVQESVRQSCDLPYETW